VWVRVRVGVTVVRIRIRVRGRVSNLWSAFAFRVEHEEIVGISNGIHTGKRRLLIAFCMEVCIQEE
jgi:hypothetical protein